MGVSAQSAASQLLSAESTLFATVACFQVASSGPLYPGTYWLQEVLITSRTRAKCLCLPASVSSSATQTTPPSHPQKPAAAATQEDALSHSVDCDAYRDAAERWLCVGPGEGALRSPPELNPHSAHLRAPSFQCHEKAGLQGGFVPALDWDLELAEFPCRKRLIVKSLWSLNVQLFSKNERGFAWEMRALTGMVNGGWGALVLSLQPLPSTGTLLPRCAWEGLSPAAWTH